MISLSYEFIASYATRPREKRLPPLVWSGSFSCWVDPEFDEEEIELPGVENADD